jgi:hypothetical protein
MTYCVFVNVFMDLLSVIAEKSIDQEQKCTRRHLCDRVGGLTDRVMSYLLVDWIVRLG